MTEILSPRLALYLAFLVARVSSVSEGPAASSLAFYTPPQLPSDSGKDCEVGEVGQVPISTFDPKKLWLNLLGRTNPGKL